MSASITIRMRLIATMAVLGLIVLASGGIGLWGLHKANAALDEVYANQLASAVRLGAMKNYLSRARFAIDRGQFRPRADDVADNMAKAEEFIRLADSQWRAYLALPLTPAERAVAATLEKTRDAYVDEGLLPVTKALADHRPADSEDLIFNQLGSRFVAFDAAWTKLQDYQLTLAQARYEDSQSFYSRVRLAFGLVLVLTALLILGASVMLLRAVTQPVDQALRHFGQIADGNLVEDIAVDRHDEMGALLAGLAAMQGRLLATVRTVRAGSGAIAQAAGEISMGNQDLSARTEKQAASLEETAASLEQMTSAVRRNAGNARRANDLAAEAAQRARDGGAHVERVVATMNEIERSSHRIVDIIAVIDGIAFQTNILALNAAVEAARAGEQGRGFAVVATEVRNLAQRAAAAAKEIKALIEQSVGHVAGGMALVTRAGTSVRETVDSVARVTAIMSDIMVAGDEQSAGIHQIHAAIAQMDATTQQNAALVEQAAAAADALEEQAGTLDRLVGGFRLEREPARRAALPGM